MSNKNDKITCEIVEQIAELSTSGSWALELNKVSWNGREPKLDIRSWDEMHEKCSKGITLTEEEAYKLMEALQDYFAANEVNEE